MFAAEYAAFALYAHDRRVHFNRLRSAGGIVPGEPEDALTAFSRQIWGYLRQPHQLGSTQGL